MVRVSIADDSLFPWVLTGKIKVAAVPPIIFAASRLVILALQGVSAKHPWRLAQTLYNRYIPQ